MTSLTSRVVVLTLAGLFVSSCSESPAPSDAGSGGALDAPSDAPELLDTPPRADAGYDSGARCERPVDLDAGSVLACNGHAALCDRRLDEVALAMTHNAMSSEEDDFSAPNQHFRLWRQLEDGVRGFMLDVYVDRDDTVQLCHGSCRIGRRPLADGLRDLRLFLDCHPHDVVVIVFEAHAPADRVEQGFVESGLDAYLHVPDALPGAGYAWPTLRELVTRNERVIVFTDDRDAPQPWHLYTYDWAWENPYSAATPGDLSCAEDRGSRDRSLWVFNHFLTNPVAGPDLAEMVNHDPFFTERVSACRDEAGGDLPNFVTVDFYDLGDVLSVVDTLNGVRP
jgi:hypothetical protein